MNRTRVFLLTVVLGLTACGGSSSGGSTATISSDQSVSRGTSGAATAARAAVDASDRSDDDRVLDAGRHPAEVLAFFGVAPGQHVAEIFAGGGYTTELLARIVGEQGKVFGHNTTMILDRFARAPWTARFEKPVMRNVVSVERELDSPLPQEAHDLDAVLLFLTYHDTVWMGADRNVMNRAIFAALKPGGVYGIVDHEAAPGHGVEDVQTLHRIERSVVVAEVEAAGFALDAESNLLRNAEDHHDWNASPREAGERRGTSDRFVLRFVKPLTAQ